MLNTKNLVITDVKIPSSWVFQHYLNLPNKLTGQDEQIFSIFNPNERTPSMYIFLDKKSMEYKFKDFSTGKYGSKVDLVKELFDLNYSKAVFKIIEDYNEYVLKNGIYEQGDYKEQTKWKIGHCHTRPWNETDRDFWLQFGIGTTILFEYRVKPLLYYGMSKENKTGYDNIQIKGKQLYGYYNKNKMVYKIYQPLNKKYKFIKISHYIQGIDQLLYKQPYLIICSSLKDAMTLRHFNYNVEVIAPDSENTMIKPYIIENLKQKYNKIITLFDNDDAGRNAIARYDQVYGIPGAFLNMSKDLSDAVKDFGFKKVHEELKTTLKNCLK